MSEQPDGRSSYRTIREFADDERPRERLLRHGPEVLSDAELVAIVLGSGIAGENVIDLARRMIDAAGGLTGLARADAKSLQRTKGLGPAKAAQLAAAVELGRRVGRLAPDSRPLLTNPEAVFAFMGPLFLGKTKERLYVLSLDTRGRMVGAPQPLAGGISSVPVRASEVFREPVVLEATSIILVHNHPSGDPRPSAQDVAVTRELVAAGELLGLAVLDHVVIGQGQFVSMQREGFGFRRTEG